jgi:hypothetical protein
MTQKYVITLFVSTTIFIAGCNDPETGTAEARAESETETGTEAVPEPETEADRHDRNGISFAALVDARYQDELTQGIASSRAALPSGVIFSVISSPDIVPGDQAHALQLENARRGARERGEILEDADTVSRSFVAGEVDGHRIVYRTRAGGTVHTEVYTFETGRRTVTVFIELPDPPDPHAGVVDALTSSLRVTMP